MGIFDDIKAKGAAYRLTEEVLREIELGQSWDGIWAKALSESDMDQGKAGAKYIKLRVQSLKDEDEVSEFLANIQREDAKRQQMSDREKPNPFRSLQRVMVKAAFG